MVKARSIIPPHAREKVVKRYGNGVKQVALYYVDRKLAGHRTFDDQGRVAVQYAIRHKVRHGPFRHYHSNGVVSWATNFVEGKEHGISRQYDEHGHLIGSYRMRHGTGADLWYVSQGHLSEERYYRNGLLNGYERWWWGRHRVYEEGHYKDGLEHGIKRAWNKFGKLRRGYPQYFINGVKVTKRSYLRATRRDLSLPVYRKEEDTSKRRQPQLSRAGLQPVPARANSSAGQGRSRAAGR
jgi:antitoxin component YwqK of YwqJK toxin-antitoxin module